jgi:hypothetical protein
VLAVDVDGAAQQRVCLVSGVRCRRGVSLLQQAL